mmetsp:Transcript_10175/g.19237  ORF Transcript_10175/g.19237 Transcript_10175/m.19237 type:complete len:298 (-) Transcript_10175:48-941(-)
MLASGLRETLKVAREVSTDFGQTLLGFASEVEEVGTWTMEGAKREAAKVVQATVPLTDSLRQKAGSVRRDGSGLQASLRNRGGVMLDEQGSAACSSTNMPSALEAPETSRGVSLDGEAESLELLEADAADLLQDQQREVPVARADDLVDSEKSHDREAAARRWAQAVKKARQLREEEDAEQQRREVLVRMQSLLQQQQEVLLLRSPGSEEDEAVGTLRSEDTDEDLILAKVNPEGKYYSLEQLTQSKVWRNLDVTPTAREFFLSDDDFRSLFEIDREAYAKLPKWKQVSLKKKHNLF